MLFFYKSRFVLGSSQVDFSDMIYYRVGGYAFGKPYIASYNGTLADNGISAKDRSARIDYDIVFDCRMSFGFGKLFRDAKSAKSDTLIYFNVFSNMTGGANHNTGAVIDKEIGSYRGGWMYVDAGTAMGVFCQDSW